MAYSRNEIDETIEILAMKYPKCFFLDHRVRLPLKKNIEVDLERDGTKIDPYLLGRVIEWYQSSFGYLYSIINGKRRVNLDGKEVESVTQQERDAAEKKLASLKRLNGLKQQRYGTHNGVSYNGVRQAPAVTQPVMAAPAQGVVRAAEPANPAMSIIFGVKALKEKLRTAARMREIFPSELVELFPDLERSISKMMDGASEIIEYCSGKKVT